LALAALGVAPWAAGETAGAVLWASCVLGWTLLALAECDRRAMLLPDALTLPLVAAGLGVAWGLFPERLLDHAIGAVVGYGALAGIAWVYARMRGREGLGLGDAKLLAAAGAWLGWQALAGVVVVAAAAALAVTVARGALRGHLGGSDAIAFGPFLALGLWLSWLYGPVTFAW
jgi:leader peptidase (prepilin peptidase)/N-methyltransferase